MKRSLYATFTLALFLAVACFPALARAQKLAYVVTSNQQFGVVNLQTGAFQPIGPGIPEPMANLVWHDGNLYSLSLITASLVKIDPATGATTFIGPTGLGAFAFDLAEARGILYATDLSNNIYTVNPDTGAATLLRATGIPPDLIYPFTTNPDGTIELCDEAFYGFADHLFAIYDEFTLDPGTLAVTPVTAAKLYEIDPSSGVAAAIAPVPLNIGSMVEVNGRFYGFRWMTLSFGAFGPQIQSQLVSIDVSNGNVTALRNIDVAAGGILGAAPARSAR